MFYNFYLELSLFFFPPIKLNLFFPHKLMVLAGGFQVKSQIFLQIQIDKNKNENKGIKEK